MGLLTVTIISSPEVSARPYLRLRAISSVCPIVYGLARPVSARAPPRANATWRVVEPPRSTVHSAKRPLTPLGLRPRVWAGVGGSLLRRPSDVDISVAFCRGKKNFLLHSQPLRKVKVALLGKVSTSCLSSRKGRVTLASGGGGMTPGMAARSPSQCR